MRTLVAGGEGPLALLLLLHPPTVSLCPAQPHFPCHPVLLVLAVMSACSYLFWAVARIPYRYELTALLTRHVRRGRGV